MPRLRRPGERVHAGTLNTLGALDIEASCAADATLLSQITGLVDEAQATKAAIARLADRVAAVFVPIVLVIALASFGAWMLLAPADIRAARAVEALVSVLVVACPCALGLATPVAIMVASGRAASIGVLFRNAAAFEQLARIGRIAFDKTGTLTEGRPAVIAAVPSRGWSEEALLGLAAAAESRSEHAVARGIVEAARARGIQVEEPGAFAAFAGKGVFAQVLSHKVEVGSAAWMRECGVAVDAPPSHATRVFVAADGAFVGTIELADRVRDHAREAMHALRAQSIEPILVTGDAHAPAAAVGASVGIAADGVYAEVSPQGKAEIVAGLSSDATGAAFVGDGLNDAAALAAARPGIAMSGGTDLAKTSADILLVGDDLRRIPQAIALARATLQVIRQNLWWAFGYNIVLIPLAAGVAFPFTGWMLPPVVASAAMALSSVTVVANSLRLRSR
jgi:Cu+-exporting ATPase